MERIFIRSEWQITYDTPEATGKRSTENECITEFGKEDKILEEMNDYGAAVLPSFYQSGLM